MGDTGIFKSKESQELFRQLTVLLLGDPPGEIAKCKLLADKFLEIEGTVLHNTTHLTIFVNTYLEYGEKYKDNKSIQKATQYAQLGYDLCVENNLGKLSFFDKYLGLSIFLGGLGSLGIEELEKTEFHLGRCCSKDSSDQGANEVLMMARKMKHDLMKSNLRCSSEPTPTKKEEKKEGGFFSKLFG